MAITEQQDIPKKAEKHEPWTVRRLFPFAEASKALARVFVSLYDVLLGYLVLIITLIELLGRPVSISLWVLTVLILFVNLFEKQKQSSQKKPEDK